MARKFEERVETYLMEVVDGTRTGLRAGLLRSC